MQLLYLTSFNVFLAFVTEESLRAIFNTLAKSKTHDYIATQTFVASVSQHKGCIVDDHTEVVMVCSINSDTEYTVNARPLLLIGRAELFAYT